MNKNTQPEEQAPIAGLHELDLSQLPQRDLWPEIATRLQPRQRRSLPGWIGYAAAASVLLGVSFMLLSDPQSLRLEQPATSEFAAAARPQGAMMAWAPPESTALVKANLHIVRDAESQLRHALEQAPESKSLQRQLQRMQGQRQSLHKLMQQADPQPGKPPAETGA